jgi:hypothetical protein
MHVKNRRKTIGIEEKLNVISRLEKLQRMLTYAVMLDSLMTYAVMLDSLNSVCKIRDNAARITES